MKKHLVGTVLLLVACAAPTGPESRIDSVAEIRLEVLNPPISGEGFAVRAIVENLSNETLEVSDFAVRSTFYGGGGDRCIDICSRSLAPGERLEYVANFRAIRQRTGGTAGAPSFEPMPAGRYPVEIGVIVGQQELGATRIIEVRR